MNDVVLRNIEKHNHENYHQIYSTWNWIDDIYMELGYGTLENEGISLFPYNMDDEEGIKSQLIAEELGLTAEEE